MELLCSSFRDITPSGTIAEDQRLLISEACDLLATGLDIFYPSAEKKLHLILALLKASLSGFRSHVAFETAGEDETHHMDLFAAELFLQRIVDNLCDQSNISHILIESPTSRNNLIRDSQFIACIVSYLADDAKAALSSSSRKLLDTSSWSQGASSPRHLSSALSSSMKLLKAIQTALLSNAAIATPEDSHRKPANLSPFPQSNHEINKCLEMLMDYSNIIFAQSNIFLQNMVDSFSATIESLRKRVYASETEEQLAIVCLFTELESVLQNSFVGILVPSLLVALAMLPNKVGLCICFVPFFKRCLF